MFTFSGWGQLWERSPRVPRILFLVSGRSGSYPTEDGWKVGVKCDGKRVRERRSVDQKVQKLNKYKEEWFLLNYKKDRDLTRGSARDGNRWIVIV